MEPDIVDDLVDEPTGLGSVVVRTDRSDDDAWQRTVAALLHPQPVDGDVPDEGEPVLVFVDHPRFDGLTPEQLPALVAERGLELNHAFLADRLAQQEADHPVIAVCLAGYPDGPDEVGRTFRVIAGEASAGVSPNLALLNMDFADFADEADRAPDGVFRGFPGY